MPTSTKVEDVELAHGEPPAVQPGPNRLAALRAASSQIATCGDLYTLLDETLAALHRHLAIDHSMLLLLDRAAARLYTVASRGHAASGVGSEIPLGAGVVGVAVREGTPIRMAGEPVTVRHYPADNSVFLGDDYLIKGVAGAVFWALVSDHVNDGRTAFGNRELRLDPRFRLPEVGDNLEARPVLLQRRLVERHACVRIEKSGRGRFGLRVERPLRLTQVG